MLKHSASELVEHPAIQAWRVLQLGPVEPQGIETFEQNKKSVIYKLLGVGLGGSAVIAKRCLYATALVERTIYEAVLPHLPLPCLHYYGFVQSDEEWCWLFFEDAGNEAYSPQIEEHRVLAARWLGIMHASAAHLAAASQLPDRGLNHYWARLQSAHAALERAIAGLTLNRDDRSLLESIVSHCDLLKGHWRQLEEACEPVPRTIVHGDFVRKNVVVRTGPSGIVLLPFDWETAGWGLPTTDLATAELAGFAADAAAVSESPEISAYRWAVCRFWPQFGGHDPRVLANLGMIFRLIDAVEWGCAGLARGRSGEAKSGSLARLRFYQGPLADAIQALARES